MRPPLLHFLVLCTLLLLASAWSKEDHEIFRLRDEVQTSEGEDVTFYDFLGVKSSASYEDIQKAFRKRSKALHPDKARHSFIASRSTPSPKKPGEKEKRKPGVHVSKGPSQREIQRFVKQANERYGRLGVVADILKSENRERYDFFLKNGFPKWRGTGYYYQRFRPGLGTVIVGLFVMMGGAAHYYALVFGWKRQRDFADRYIRQARKAAWGDESGIRGIAGLNDPVAIPTATVDEPDSMANLNRRQKRELEKQSRKDKSAKNTSRTGKSTNTPAAATPAITSPMGEKKRVVAENGKILVVDSIGNVFLEEEDEDGQVVELLLDIDEVPRPTVHDTALVRLPLWLYHKMCALTIRREQENKREHESESRSGSGKRKKDTTIETAVPQAVPESAEPSSDPYLDAELDYSAESFEMVEASLSASGAEKEGGNGSGIGIGPGRGKKRAKKGKR